MTQTVFHDIPGDLLAALLDREGEPTDLSPRRLLGPPGPVNRHQLAELYAGGFVQLPRDGGADSTPEFARAARVILDPRTILTIRLWGDEAACAETSVLFPGDPLEGNGVIFNPLDKNYRLVAPVGVDDVIGLVSPAIPPATDIESTFTFEGHFEAPVAATLFGLVDLVRLQPDHAPFFTATELGASLQGRWGLTGFEHLTSYISAVGLMPTPPPLAAVEYALDVLLAAGVVLADGHGGFGLAESVSPLTTLMPPVAPGVQWQRISAGSDGDLLTSHRVFVFGDQSLVLSFAPMPQGRIFISTTTASDLKDFVVSELATLLPHGRPSPPTDSVTQGDTVTARTVSPAPSPVSNAGRWRSLRPVLAVMVLTPALLSLSSLLGPDESWKTFYAAVSILVGLVVGIFLRRRSDRRPAGLWRGLGLYFGAALLAVIVFDLVMVIRSGVPVSGAEFMGWYVKSDALVALGISVLGNGLWWLGGGTRETIGG